MLLKSLGANCWFQSRLFYLLTDICEIWCTYVKSKLKNILFMDFFEFRLSFVFIVVFVVFLFIFSLPIFKSIELNDE